MFGLCLGQGACREASEEQELEFLENEFAIDKAEAAAIAGVEEDTPLLFKASRRDTGSKTLGSMQNWSATPHKVAIRQRCPARCFHICLLLLHLRLNPKTTGHRHFWHLCHLDPKMS